MVLMPIRRKIYMKKTPFYLEEENNPQNGFSVIADFEGETEDLLKEFNLNGYLDQVSDNREEKDLREENNKEDNNK